MKLLKRFLRHNDIYEFNIIEIDMGDAMVIFDDGKIRYVVDLDWDDGVMDIEFRVVDDETGNTTNLHCQYKILRTVSFIVKSVISKIKEKIHTITFRSSRLRDGMIDERSGIIRNQFFIRYVLKEYPNAKVYEGDRDITIINLNKTL
jgi:hypothetical protein